MSPGPCMPYPIPAITIRSLAGTAPSFPRAEALIIVGKPAIPAKASGTFFRKSRRGMDRNLFITPPSI
jgi:hypothetical protein